MNQQKIKSALCDLGEKASRMIYQYLINHPIEERVKEQAQGIDDIIYQIDTVVEKLILKEVKKMAKSFGGIVLIAEGMNQDGQPLVFSGRKSSVEPALRLIIDPIDGTRGLMYDKRSAFFLAGAAENKGDQTSFSDIEVAVMVEIPCIKSYWSDMISAIKGKGVERTMLNLSTNYKHPKSMPQLNATTIYGGFAQISRFFPNGKTILAEIEERLLETLFPDVPEGRAYIFEDQYISTGGQIYEMLMGKDRFIADIRDALFCKMKKQGKKVGHVCHPYDICITLICKESKIIITDIEGNPLDSKLDVVSGVNWIGYANQHIRDEVEPIFQNLLREYQLF